MITLVALLIAILFLPAPWNVLLVVSAALVDIAETAVFIWWSRRRRGRSGVAVGAETIVGRPGVALGRLDPAVAAGQVRVDGEIWNARTAEPIDRGAAVTVTAVDGLLLDVEPARRA